MCLLLDVALMFVVGSCCYLIELGQMFKRQGWELWILSWQKGSTKGQGVREDVVQGGISKERGGSYGGIRVREKRTGTGVRELF